MSCLFNSLGRLINRDPDELRQSICDYLETNPDLFGDGEFVDWTEADTDIQTYVQQMRQPSTWGGGTEISAFIQIFGHDVIVHDLTNRGREIHFQCKHAPIVTRPGHGMRLRSKQKTLHISWSGAHYEPFVK